MARQHGIPVIIMRGGTSKGPYFRTDDLPADEAARDRVLLAAMGSPDARQIDGIGGADTLTSKVAMVRPSARDGVDVDYLFAQVSVTEAVVDTSPSCGNILSGVGPFAIERGMVPVTGEETRVVIFNENTASRIEAVVRTDGQGVDYDGDQAIAGVPGTAAAVRLNFMDIVGSKTSGLLPSGQVQEDIDGVPVTLIDVAVPMMILRAADMGKTGHETPAELDADRDFFARLEAMRQEAGRRMGLGDVTGKVIPKVAILAPARGEGHIAARYFVPQKTHAAFAVTGALCVATVAVLEGSVSDGIARRPDGEDREILIEHPSGLIDVALRTTGQGADLQVVSAGAIRTARKLVTGEVFVPAAALTGA
ncbi:4-oxalomesaconate tautomerase [Paracoccus aestuarii]|uniref:4-oxalomesaconate tautomerase n=1 Tax=Paracoccus aestuarii TaxID=453842 RepID=A0A418ZZR4_9RHOB|nr:4-oxalomesaconate tautomerase [Paracoccus aestuarii]RJL05962.1 4-oxalomesaconate tautomerase [Paracoccus aestuarii]WCQ98422.1 4-oxalomesaconate tautomerase [Paracoccus aestuarii]